MVGIAGGAPLPNLAAHADVPVAGGILVPALSPLQEADSFPGVWLFLSAAPQAEFDCPGSMLEPNLPQLAYSRLPIQVALVCGKSSWECAASFRARLGLERIEVDGALEEKGCELGERPCLCMRPPMRSCDRLWCCWRRHDAQT